MPLGDDGDELAGAEQAEVERGVGEVVGHRHELAALEEEVVDRLLDLEDVEVDVELGEAPADVADGARGEELRDRGHRGEGELGVAAALQRGERRG